jgi:hypothetical protein
MHAFLDYSPMVIIMMTELHVTRRPARQFAD